MTTYDQWKTTDPRERHPAFGSLYEPCGSCGGEAATYFVDGEEVTLHCEECGDAGEVATDRD